MQLAPFMLTLGFQGGITAPGQARLQVVLKPEHLNSWGSTRGGFQLPEPPIARLERQAYVWSWCCG
jgi:hypothetical protein